MYVCTRVCILSYFYFYHLCYLVFVLFSLFVLLVYYDKDNDEGRALSRAPHTHTTASPAHTHTQHISVQQAMTQLHGIIGVCSEDVLHDACHENCNTWQRLWTPVNLHGVWRVHMFAVMGQCEEDLLSICVEALPLPNHWSWGVASLVTLPPRLGVGGAPCHALRYTQQFLSPSL